MNLVAPGRGTEHAVATISRPEDPQHRCGTKDGQSVLYSVPDPEIFKLLDVAKKIFNNHLIDVKDLLSQLAVTSASRG